MDNDNDIRIKIMILGIIVKVVSPAHLKYVL